MNKIITFLTIASMGINIFMFKEDVPIEALSIEQRAEMAEMTVDEFVLISSVTEAESNRCTDSTEGRRYIALCILCRVMDSRFPDTITEVLTQRGQFSTVRNGHSVTQRTDLSDQAVIEAVAWINSGEEYPWVLFFNCTGYSYGEPLGRYGGNYFVTLEPMIEEET